MRLGTFVVVAAGLAAAGCASSRKAEAPDSTAAPAVLPAPPPATAAPGAGTPTGQAVGDEVGRARFRSLEAQRELESALAEQSAANAEQARAAGELESARRSTDSVAQARATELARAAESRRRVADAHVDYARKLVAARAAEVRAASAHARVAEVDRIAAPPTPSAPVDPQLAAARNAEETARAEASRLGEEALAAQRSWQELSREAQAGAFGAPPAPAPSPASAPSPATAPSSAPATPPADPAAAPTTGR
jgi:hypothetical protein